MNKEDTAKKSAIKNKNQTDRILFLNQHIMKVIELITYFINTF